MTEGMMNPLTLRPKAHAIARVMNGTIKIERCGVRFAGMQSAADILATLDAACDPFAFPMLDNG